MSPTITVLSSIPILTDMLVLSCTVTCSSKEVCRGSAEEKMEETNLKRPFKWKWRFESVRSVVVWKLNVQHKARGRCIFDHLVLNGRRGLLLESCFSLPLAAPCTLYPVFSRQIDSLQLWSPLGFMQQVEMEVLLVMMGCLWIYNWLQGCTDQ